MISSIVIMKSAMKKSKPIREDVEDTLSNYRAAKNSMTVMKPSQHKSMRTVC
jgi:hypothetical protein